METVLTIVAGGMMVLFVVCVVAAGLLVAGASAVGLLGGVVQLLQHLVRRTRGAATHLVGSRPSEG